jgi:phytoene/squalene synthetase
MKELFDSSSIECSKLITHRYSTSFSNSVKLLAPSIRNPIYAIYGFVRFADEIVDTFHDYDKEVLLNEFEREYYVSMERGISLNPILNCFQQTVKKYQISDDLVSAFLKSMRMDLTKKEYKTTEEYKEYIYGSADVVGLMCLKVFVNGNEEKYQTLKSSAMALGSALQKVNFLRDIKDDIKMLDRTYFPNVDFTNFCDRSKQALVEEIEHDFRLAYEGIQMLPKEAQLGVYTAYLYYKSLLSKLKKTKSSDILKVRIRVPDFHKLLLVGRSYLSYQLNLI